MPKQTVTQTFTYSPDEVRAILAAHLANSTNNRISAVAADVTLQVKDRVSGEYHEPDEPAAFMSATITIKTEVKP